MDCKMHWMEPSIAARKQESNTLETVGFPSMLPSVAYFQSNDMTDVGHAHLACAQHPSQHPTAQCPAPACASHDQQYLLAPFSQPDSYDGSLNDILVPYQYAKLLDDLLSEQHEPLGQQLAPIAQFEKTPLCHRNIPFPSGDSIILNCDGVSANDDIELASAISKSHHDAKNAMMVSSLPSITPMPALPRRPPMRKGTASYRKNHIRTERQRRQDMTSLFNRLKSVLPNMQHDDLKGDRSTILEHVIDYVQELDKKVQALGKMKAELMQSEEGALNHHQHRRLAQQAALASVDSVSVRPWGHVDIFITLNCPKHRGFWPNLLALLQDTLQLDVQNVALSSTPFFWVHFIYAKVLGDESEEVCCKVKNTLREFVTDQAYNNYRMR